MREAGGAWKAGDVEFGCVGGGDGAAVREEHGDAWRGGE